MEGEIVFYEQADLDNWRPRPRGLVAEVYQTDTTSPLGRLYALWNERNRLAREAYEQRNYEIWRSDRARGRFDDDISAGSPALDQHPDGDAALRVPREGM